MKCAEVRNWLGALADGEVRASAHRSALEAHLRECAVCRREYAIQVEVKRMVQAAARVQPSPALATRIRTAMRPRRRLAVGRLQLAYAAAVLIAAVVITAGVLSGLQRNSGVYKELPAVATMHGSRGAAWDALTPGDEAVVPSNFVDFVQSEHNQALEFVRARSEWAENLDRFLALIEEDGMVDEETHLKGLPEAETSKRDGNKAR